MRTAIVTASYKGDLDRCRLLCESIDRRVTGHSCHYILVEQADVALFRHLEGARRRVIDERSLLPWWLRPFPDPLSLGRRRVWLSPKGPPLRGWHVQQLRRIAMAVSMDEEAMVSCDSDVVFVKPLDMSAFWHGSALRFYRKPGGFGTATPKHRAWSRKAGELLGLGDGGGEVDYIATVIAWRADTARAMVERISEVGGRPWVSALAATRSLSECLLYGRFVDEVEKRSDRHVPTDRQLCHTYWNGAALTPETLGEFTAQMEPDQVAVGIQSFTATDPALIRRFVGLG